MRKLSPKALDLIGQLLTKDPASRITAQQALENSWFQHHQASSRRLPHSHAATAIGQPQQQEQQATD